MSREVVLSETPEDRCKVKFYDDGDVWISRWWRLTGGEWALSNGLALTPAEVAALRSIFSEAPPETAGEGKEPPR